MTRATSRRSAAARVVVVPNGVDCSAYRRRGRTARPGPPSLLYVGALDWPPNASAARLLATEILPSVRQRVPDGARRRSSARTRTPEVLALARTQPNVEVAGNVRDVVPYFRGAHVLAVPLESGGGTRLKILEAFAAGLPVVSTPVGCEGIDGVHEQHLLVADRPQFADAIVQALLDPAAAQRTRERARSSCAAATTTGRRWAGARSTRSRARPRRLAARAAALKELAMQTEMPIR